MTPPAADPGPYDPGLIDAAIAACPECGGTGTVMLDWAGRKSHCTDPRCIALRAAVAEVKAAHHLLSVVADSPLRLEQVTAERDKLQAFKDWVHNYLDGKGVPHHPPGTHGAEGCRIGDRMDHVFVELESLRIARTALAAEVERVRAELEYPGVYDKYGRCGEECCPCHIKASAKIIDDIEAERDRLAAENAALKERVEELEAVLRLFPSTDDCRRAAAVLARKPGGAT